MPPSTGGGRADRPVIAVRSLMADEGLGIDLTLIAGAAGLDRPIMNTRIQKSGLALVGHFHGIVPTRVQILGQTELSFLHKLSREDRLLSLRGFFELGLCCVIVTQGDQPFEANGSGIGFVPVPELAQCAEETGTPLLVSAVRSSATITALHALLDDRLAPRLRLHGVLVDVFGVGLLLMGSSAIGKSECALDLVMRGHRLVADDAVECDYRPPGMVFGAPAELLRYHLEVRGLGILNVKDLFGVTSIRERKRIDVVVKLVEWSKDTEYDRLGLDERYHTILGVKIRELVIPVRPGRDMASILEVAARNELLKNAGFHAAREFFGNVEGELLRERSPEESSIPPPARLAEEGASRSAAPPGPPRPPPPGRGVDAPNPPSSAFRPPADRGRPPPDRPSSGFSPTESSVSLPRPRRRG
ncbi:HPr(Ser) kinase/phosphatase [Sorangium atrum]|uniref:HPr kinase/phosphorylase n=1 Tax=Sorangium atrum TaxID=2995308 RepID=A0ABT5BWG7_9BACT|nr:HPr(Ser) kinase/phosphatase [Sorangium aterium]MDC0677935.1 HPr(Ser) kinase/phosphatase [Sorangium aterium]